jgi:hypothetical protein
VVNQESCVHYQGYYYHVPGDYLFKSCPLRVTQDHIMVYSHDFKLLISHPLAIKGATGRYIGLPAAHTHAMVLRISEVKRHDRLELQVTKEAHLLFKVVDERYQLNRSLIFTTNVEEKAHQHT